MFTERPPSRDLPPIYESPALRRQPAPAALFGPRPAQHPCPVGYEDYFGHAVLGRPINLEREPFLLQTALEAAGFISGDIDAPQNGDLIIPVPEQEGPRDDFFAMLDRSTTYMAPFYRTRPQIAGEPHEWRSVVLLQFVNNEWQYFSSQYDPTILTTNNGRTISQENLHIYFNPETRLPLDDNGQPYIQLFTMTPDRFRDIMGINHRLQNSIDVNAELTALIGVGELMALPVAGRGRGIEPQEQYTPPPHRSGAAASEGANVLAPSQQPQPGATASGTQFAPTQQEGATGFTPDPSYFPQYPLANQHQLRILPQDVSHLRPVEDPYRPVDANRYRHLPSASCVDQSLEFLCQHFGLPDPQWPDAQNVLNHNGLDIAAPLIIGQSQGFIAPWPLGADSREITEVEPTRLYNIFDEELDKESTYFVFIESSSGYGNAHTVALYFDYNENEWFVFNNLAEQGNGLPVKVTDAGNFTLEGRNLFMPAARRGVPAVQQRRLSIFPMNNERVEFMCEVVRRARTSIPADEDLAFYNFEQRYIMPAQPAGPPVRNAPDFTRRYQFSTSPERVQITPPAQNLYLPPMVPQARYQHLAGIGCGEQTLDFAARCFGMPVPIWNDPAAVRYTAPLDLNGALTTAARIGLVSPQSIEASVFGVRNRQDAEAMLGEGAAALDINNFYLMTVSGTLYGNHIVAVYFDTERNRWFSFNNIAPDSQLVLGYESMVKPVPLTNAEGTLTPEGVRLLCPVQAGQTSTVIATALTSDGVEMLCEWVRRIRQHGEPFGQEVASLNSTFGERRYPAEPEED
ncbi:MAG: hypothetical protein ACRC9T_09480 [Vibrionaceae bacterium]